MPPPKEREGDVCVYAVSCLLFLAIVAGGAFLLLYIALPESPGRAWFPIAGMVLVGIPWLFWITTCLYRAVSLRKPARGAADRAPVRPATVVPAAAATNEDAAVDSPGGGRRVRFGTATVMGGSPDVTGGGGDGSLEKANEKPREEGDGGSHATIRSTESIEDASSLTSHESELPLFV
uniref:Quinoprotein glucose dehydrogenase n=1 Tax=Anthurium amnicola TaxID=1678845 RepID=A0A1D1XK74_9ARAE